jgi:hypothetical protein
MRSMAAQARVNVEVLLRHLKVPAKRRGSTWWARCPLPTHDDSTPSWSMVGDDRNEHYCSWYCFGCGTGGGPMELVRAIKGVSRSEALAWLKGFAAPAEEYQAPVVEIAARIPGRLRWPMPGAEPSFERWPERAQRYWMETRGMPMLAAGKYDVAATGSDCAEAPRSIVFPVVSFGALRTWVARSYVPSGKKHNQARRDDGAQPDLALWGEPWLDETWGPVLVCEGIFDALSLSCMGFQNAVAVLGASSITPAKVAAIARCKVAVICTDADDAGDRAADELSQTLARHCRKVGRARPPAGTDWGNAPAKDITEIVGKAVAEVWP